MAHPDKTISSAHGYAASYYGDRPDWIIAYTMHRDSDAMTASNFEAMRRILSDSYADDIAVERSSHWAVGWLDHLIVNPACIEALNRCSEMYERLESYPILDDDLYDELGGNDDYHADEADDE